jgi:hypothetical protein
MKRFVQDMWILTLYIYIYTHTHTHSFIHIPGNIYIYIYISCRPQLKLVAETSLLYRYCFQPFLGSNPDSSLPKMEGPKLEIAKRSIVYKL